jgi:uncharacterized protein YjbI with pentapeptide repeats
MSTGSVHWKLLEGVGPSEMPDRLLAELGVPPGAPIGAHHVVGGDGASLATDTHLHIHDVEVQCGNCGHEFVVGEADLGTRGWLDATSSVLLTCPTCQSSIRVTGLVADGADADAEDAGVWIVTTQLTIEPQHAGPGWPSLTSGDVDVELPLPPPPVEPPADAAQVVPAPPIEPPAQVAAPETKPPKPPKPPRSPRDRHVSGRIVRRMLAGVVAVSLIAGAVYAVTVFTRKCEDLVAGASLAGCNFAGQDFAELDLTGADLSGADLSEAVLVRTVLSGADLSDSNLAGADLTRARLDDADLTGADLTGAVLDDADLRRTDATNAVFTEAVLTDARLGEGTFTGAQFDRAQMDGTDLSDATADGAVFTGAQAPDAQLRRSTLTGAQFDGVDLSGAGFVRADLTAANLTGADLSGVRLEEAVVTEANFTGATLRDAWLTGIVGLEGPQLAAALGTTEDQIPEALLRANVRFETPERMATESAVARDGLPVPFAAGYQPGPGYHPAVVLDADSDQIADWADALGVSPGLSFTELVVVPAEEERVLQVCEYWLESGVPALPITRLDHVTTVTIVDAATGDIVAMQEFVGSEPRACLAEMPASLQGSRFVGDPAPTSEIVTWVNGFVNAP